MSLEIEISSVEIRKAEGPDAPDISQLVSELGYPTTETEMLRRLEALNEGKSFHTFVAVYQKKVIGAIGLGFAPYFERNGFYARILLLVVGSLFRGKGIGRRLVRTAEDFVKTQGISGIVVNTGNHRLEAHKFYEREGYKLTGVRFVKEVG